MNAIFPLVDRENADPNTLAYNTRTTMPTAEEEEAAEEEGDNDIPELLPAGDAEGDEEEQEFVQEVEARLEARQRLHRQPLPEKTPFHPYGMHFLRPLHTVPVPRLGWAVSFLNDQAVRFIYGMEEDEVMHMILCSRVVKPRNTNRTENRKKTTTFVNHGQAPQQLIFDFAARGYTLPPIPDVNGDELDVELLDDLLLAEGNRMKDLDIDVVVTEIWYQFLLDLTEMPLRRPIASFLQEIESSSTRRRTRTWSSHITFETFNGGRRNTAIGSRHSSTFFPPRKQRSREARSKTTSRRHTTLGGRT
ncbi:unnamed protein product [Cyclocybe aegerita]|uniref:Uncharacterized protein n=1 Tax=Cyclocybe aegerita TaxID=1973307 RepID=A0A8S0WYS5_CYCAE|nr:unnamed protein product [Cyclocybe aegerita]